MDVAKIITEIMHDDPGPFGVFKRRAGYLRARVIAQVKGALNDKIEGIFVEVRVPINPARNIREDIAVCKPCEAEMSACLPISVLPY
jgi:hypothetical protein